MQFLHDCVNFSCVRLIGYLLLGLLGGLHFNVAVDADYLDGWIIEAFKWRFGYCVGVFVQFEMVST